MSATSPPATLPVQPTSEPHVSPGGEPTLRQRGHLDRLLLLGLSLVGLVVRLLVERGVWLDEAISARQAHLPFVEMLTDLRFGDVHPPGHHSVLWVTVRALGDGELALRAPSIAAGVAVIPLLYLTGRLAYDRRAGLAAAAFGTVAPLMVWYSHEARAYALFMLLALAAVYGQLIVLKRAQAWGWVLYTVATVALLWTHYFASIQVAVQLLAFVAVAWTRWRSGAPVLRPLLLPLTAVVLVIGAAMVPLAPFALDQYQANTSGGGSRADLPTQAGGDAAGLDEDPTVYALGANLVWAIWGFHSDEVMTRIVGMWPLAMLLGLALLGRGRSLATNLLVATVVSQVAILFAVGFHVRIAFEVRQFGGAVPLLLLLIARFVTAIPRRKVYAALGTLVVVATLVVGLVDQQVNEQNPRIHDVRSAVAEIERRAGERDVLVYAPAFLEDVVRYYGRDLPNLRAPGESIVTEPGARVFLLGGFLDEPRYAAVVGDTLARLEEDLEVVDEFEHPQVQVWVLEHSVAEPQRRGAGSLRDGAP
jgi:hypothetical protein